MDQHFQVICSGFGSALDVDRCAHALRRGPILEPIFERLGNGCGGQLSLWDRGRTKAELRDTTPVKELVHDVRDHQLSDAAAQRSSGGARAAVMHDQIDARK